MTRARITREGTRFSRALFAFVALPGIVAGVVPALIAYADTRFQSVSPVGFVLAGIGLLLLLRCVREFFVSGKGTLAPWDPPKHLVVVGLYRYVRNPMYLAVLTVVLGWSLAFRSVGLGVYLAVLAIGFHFRVVLYEEPRLARQFGAEWSTYSASVGRWMPRLGLKTWRFILFLALLAFIAVTAFYSLRKSELSYAGRPLSKWLPELALDPSASQKARRALRSIGTNALPRLSAMVRATDPFWKRGLLDWRVSAPYCARGVCRTFVHRPVLVIGGLWPPLSEADWWNRSELLAADSRHNSPRGLGL